MSPEPAHASRIESGHAPARARDAAEALLAAASGADDLTRVQCMCRAASLFIASDEAERGAKLLSEVLDPLGERLPSSHARGLASLLWSRARLRLRGLGWRGGNAAPSLRLATFEGVAAAVAALDPIASADYRTRALLLALDTGDPKRASRAFASEAAYLASQGSIARGRVIVEAAARLARETSDPSLVACARASEGILAYHACDYLDARELLLEAERLHRDVGDDDAANAARVFRLGAIATVGLFAELEANVADALRDADRRGDAHASYGLARIFNVVWLARDEAPEALRMLDEKKWRAPQGRYHVLSFFELMARIELDLYAGDVSATRSRLRGEIAALERSILMRTPTTRAMANWLLGRLVCAEGGDARAYAARLDHEDLPAASVCASLLRASSATEFGDDGGALAHLDDAITGGVSADLLYWSAVARRRRGELVGGDEGAALVREADAWLAAQGVRRPDRFASLVTPPFR